MDFLEAKQTKRPVHTKPGKTCPFCQARVAGTLEMMVHVRRKHKD